ncbi:thioesterase family protein [Lysinibacillus sp. SGAir0095]|uniref:acyl-CoA thioesterase n=1 Tax=Lysinibacillus sp. SGAir0095 TaxID=2070463 RepID=UPI0010CCFADD|nr:thioesterase family protein [Lysinibacillus sp. SGAir0095]QCR33427.1 acyl-CoA thioesterase [Lysinibacillus sp. SGAir0095]
MNSITEIVVKEEDIDSLGHVNHMIYLQYLQAGRTDWFKKTGLSFEKLNKRNIESVVLKLEILYKQEAKVDERLIVKTIPLRLGNTSFVFEQKILNQREEVITEATVTEVMFDLITRKSRPVVDEIILGFQKE